MTSSDSHEWFYHHNGDCEGGWFHTPEEAIEDWAFDGPKMCDISTLTLWRARRAHPGEVQFDNKVQAATNAILDYLGEWHFEDFGFDEFSGYEYSTSDELKTTLLKAISKDWAASTRSFSIHEKIDPYEHCDVDSILREMWEEVQP